MRFYFSRPNQIGNIVEPNVKENLIYVRFTDIFPKQNDMFELAKIVNFVQISYHVTCLVFFCRDTNEPQ